jgi:hypothetical protein
MTTTTITPQKEKHTIKSFFPIVEWLHEAKGLGGSPSREGGRSIPR